MRRAFIIALALAILIAGCAQQPAQVKEEGKVTVTDMLGRTVEVPEKVERVVAIGPGA